LCSEKTINIMNRYLFLGLATVLVAILWLGELPIVRDKPFLDRLLSEDDKDFYAKYTNLTLPFGEWTHLAHVRLGYIVCSIETAKHENGVQIEADELYQSIYSHLKNLILTFNAKHAEKLNVGFHETITHLWTHLILKAFLSGDHSSFEQFLQQNPDLKTFDASYQYYSREILFSPAAKAALVKPSLKPFDIEFIASDPVE
jgi:hypothetical protein